MAMNKRAQRMKWNAIQCLWTVALLLCVSAAATPSAEYFSHFHDRIQWDVGPEQAAPIASSKPNELPQWTPPPRNVWLLAVSIAFAVAIALQLLVHLVRQARSLCFRLRLAAAVRDGDGPRFRKILLDAHRAPPGADALEFADSLPEKLRDFLKKAERIQFFPNT